ncbi:hypothetical protein PHMEG_00021976 [Phytophthora megakarya]|uniref:VASt domain-containing protein n=1 Tax=Phytophthora megakarya TaxID=4795 RepID=A0A225VKJ4_9STRA|nr:hypothetical protein PHMEG_00021976 [Phytophthora megakarya]
MEHVVGKWEDSAEFGGQIREMKYRAKSTSPLGPSTTMAEQIVHVPFSSQDRDSMDTDRLVIEHKLTLTEIPYGDCFHVETVYVIEPRTDAIGSPLIAKVYIGIPFSKSTMFKSKIMSATKEGVVKSTKMVFDGFSKTLDTEKTSDTSESSHRSTSADRSQPRRSLSAGVVSRRRPSVARYNSTLDGSVGLEEIFENQRVSMFGKWAPNHLLPTDRPRFSNRDGDKAMSFEQVSLPPHWSWTTPWRIDKSYTDCDDEGWSYATDFPRFKFHLARGKSSMKRLGASVRRRRWIRMMAYVPPDATDSPSVPVNVSRRNRTRGSQGSSSSSMVGLTTQFESKSSNPFKKRSVSPMIFSRRVLLLMVLVMATSCSWLTEARAPQPISARYDQFRQRMLQQRLDRQQSYETKEREFFNRKRN